MVAEGCRGSLAKVLIRHFGLADGRSPQTYGLGIKELWQLPAGRVEPGLIQHTVGWPVDQRTYGGSFLYHLDQNRVYVGYVAGLDYEDPRFRPFEAFQQFKQHPSQRPLFEGGELLSYGARTIVEGGWQSLPRLDMPGAVLIGDAGGLVNVPKIKGVHQAIRSRRARRRTPARKEHQRGIRAALARLGGRTRALQGAQHAPRVSRRALGRARQCRARDRHRRPHALDPEEPRGSFGAPASRGRTSRRIAAGSTATSRRAIG